MKRMILVIFSLWLLTGCWSNREINDTSIVHGVGFDKSDDKTHFIFEIIKPGGESSEQGGGSQSSDQGNAQQTIILEETRDTFLAAARKSIKFTKRRLDFGHTKTWIISEDLAKENFIRILDPIRRDQMFRLNSHIFITTDNPTDILNTPTFYEELVSLELASSLNQTKYVTDFAPITMREFYRLLEGPLLSAYIPIIYLTEMSNEKITAIDGTAVINKDRMVGKLDSLETAGLNILLNNINGGSIQVILGEDKKVSLEISNLKTKTIPKLVGNQLEVSIETKFDGTLADNLTSNTINETFYKEIEKSVSKEVNHVVRSTLNKLQELKTDITDIGPKTHRKYPKQWQSIREEWHDIFANANVSIDVDTNVTHQGLINESIDLYNKPHNNPYRFSK